MLHRSLTSPVSAYQTKATERTDSSVYLPAVDELDEYFIEKEIGQDIEDDEQTTLDIIKKEDVQLVCYEWFKSS